MTESEKTAPRACCYHCGQMYPLPGPQLPAGSPHVLVYEGHQEGACRAIVICSVCFDEGGFDMWTDEGEWDSKTPLVPYCRLPPYDHNDPECDDVSKYPLPLALIP